MQSKVEAEWMWGLLHPSLLAGQGGYYLSLLSSSLHLIKVSIFLFLWKQRLMNDSIQLNPPLKNVRALLGSKGPPPSPLVSPTLSVLGR